MGWRWLWWCFACSAVLSPLLPPQHEVQPRVLRVREVRRDNLVARATKSSCIRDRRSSLKRCGRSRSRIALALPLELECWVLGEASDQPDHRLDRLDHHHCHVCREHTYLHKRVVVCGEVSAGGEGKGGGGWRREREQHGGWSERVERAQLHVHCEDDDDEHLASSRSNTATLVS